MLLCPCNSQIDYALCCQPYLDDIQIPPSPEALMRSRYSAYSRAEITYIVKTMRGKACDNFDEHDAKKGAEKIKWIGLKIIHTENHTPDVGYVEFIAKFIEGHQLKFIHEVSEFHRDQGRWFYVDGRYPDESKMLKNQHIARNTLCPCGSLKKFKNCHAR